MQRRPHVPVEFPEKCPPPASFPVPRDDEFSAVSFAINIRAVRRLRNCGKFHAVNPGEFFAVHAKGAVPPTSEQTCTFSISAPCGRRSRTLYIRTDRTTGQNPSDVKVYSHPSSAQRNNNRSCSTLPRALKRKATSSVILYGRRGKTHRDGKVPFPPCRGAVKDRSSVRRFPHPSSRIPAVPDPV